MIRQVRLVLVLFVKAVNCATHGNLGFLTGFKSTGCILCIRETKGAGRQASTRCQEVAVTHPPPPLVLPQSGEKPNVIIFQSRPDNEHNLSPFIHIRSAHARWHPLRFPKVRDDSSVSNGGVDKQSVSSVVREKKKKTLMEMRESGKSEKRGGERE